MYRVGGIYLGTKQVQLITMHSIKQGLVQRYTKLRYRVVSRPQGYPRYLIIVPFVVTLLKGRFVVFSQWLLIGYIMSGDCPAGLSNWPRRVGALSGARNRGKATAKIRRHVAFSRKGQ